MPTESLPMGILQRSSRLVQLLAERGPMSTADAAEQVGMPRPSLYRLADALTQARLLETTPDGRLRVSLHWLRLADATREGMTEWAGARDVLDDLATVTGQTVYLSLPRADRAVCIDWSRGRGVSVLALKPGRTLPLYAGAAGRVTLAFRPEPLEEYLEDAPFPPFTEHTLTSADELRADVAATQGRGYSVSDEDVTRGIGALGVPLIRDGTLKGALSLGGLADEFRANRPSFTAALRSAASQLTSSS